MKKIIVRLNEKSINEAKATLKQMKKELKEMTTQFLEECCKWIIKKANDYIDSSDIGSLVKEDIKSSWHYEIKSPNATIKNTSEKAVYVEFGVGVVGEAHPHPNARIQPLGEYEYNKESPSKSVDGSWTFFTNSEELDLPTSSLLAHNWYEGKRGVMGQAGKRLLVTTKGAKGVMYAYNALMDIQNGHLKKIWEELKSKSKYWGH